MCAPCVHVLVSNVVSGRFMVPAVWSNPTYSFDNVFAGMLCLFEVCTLEGWTNVMYSAIDINGENMQPKQGNYSVLSSMFFILQIFICTFFILNMVIGVIIERFSQMSGRGMLTEEQKGFKDMIVMLVTQDTSPPPKPPENQIRRGLHLVTTNEYFETAVLVLLVANSIVMAMEYCSQSDIYAEVLAISNDLFVLLFLIELWMRFIALQWRAYFQDGWNIFDFAVIHACAIMFFLKDVGLPVQALRPLRLLLIFRMVKRAKGIRLMVNTLMTSLPACFNIGSLLFLCYFIYAIVGMQMFGNVRFGHALNANCNFRDFPSSVLLLIRVMTGANWNAIMHDLGVAPPYCTAEETKFDGNQYWAPNDCGNAWFATVYFVSFHVVGIWAVLNLFFAVILDNFTFCANIDDAKISATTLAVFKEEWFKITMGSDDMARHGGQYMALHRVQEFMGQIGSPLGFDDWNSDSRQKYNLIQEEARRAAKMLAMKPKPDVKAAANVGIKSKEAKQSKAHRKVVVGLMRTTWLGISFKRLQHIMTMHAVGTKTRSMPYADTQTRTETVRSVAEHRAAAKIGAMVRGIVARKRAREKKQTALIL